MKQILSFIFLFILSLFYISGPEGIAMPQSKIDSLFTLLKKDKEDTSKVNHLNELSIKKYLADENIVNKEDSKMLLIEALRLSQKLNYLKGEVDALRNIGFCLDNENKLNDALQYFFDALKKAEKLKDKNRINDIYIRIGTIYSDLGFYDKTADYYFKALKIAEELNNKKTIANSYNSLGSLYSSINDQKKSLKYHFEALEIRKELNDSLKISHSLLNIGNTYFVANKLDSAIYYYKQALIIQDRMENTVGKAYTFGNLGSVYLELKDFDNALFYASSGIKIFEANNDKIRLAQGYDVTAQIYLNTGNLEEAKKYFEKVLIIGKETMAKEILEAGYLGLHLVYEKMKKLDEALRLYKLYVIIKDSISNTNVATNILNIQQKYQFEKEEKIRKIEEEKKESEHKAEVKQQQTVIWSAMGGFLLVVVFSGFMFSRWRITQRQKKIIETQKLLVDEKNKDITDSIHYASRIQRALLTSDGYIGRHLKDYFILFKPKDIVSGDFYWAFSPLQSVGKQTFYFACCDCTGHGVPGAFMSLLNISFLNEAVIEKDLRDTDIILNNVRTSVVKALNPDGSTETKDGMDAVLCSIDLKNNVLHASCANNPLWILRNGEVQEIAPDKMPVGIHTNMSTSFTKHSVSLQKGDTIYLFTDGFADQFGGPKGKKFKYKQLEEKLLAIGNKSMNEQREILEQIFDEWKGYLEQVDDVLVIGIRI